MQDNFAKNLKRLRKSIGLTQDELAKQLGLKKTTISNYETAFSSPTKNVLVNIARFFNVSLDELFRPFTPPDFSNTSPSFAESGNMRKNTAFSNAEVDATSASLDLANFFGSPKYNGCFVLKMPDDSLSSKGIAKDDYIVFSPASNVPNGSVAALSVNGGTPQIGIFNETENEISLYPSSKGIGFLPRFFPKDKNNIQILGKALQALINI